MNDELGVILSKQNAPLSTLSLSRILLSPDVPVCQVSVDYKCEMLVYPLIGNLEINNELSIKGRDSVLSPLRQVLRLWNDVSGETVLHFSRGRKSRFVDALIVIRELNANEESAEDGLYHIYSEDIVSNKVGVGSYRRTVRSLESQPLDYKLYAGETINPPGCWSSYPSHANASDLLKWADWQEVFFVITPGYGMMKRDGIFHDGKEVHDSIVVRNGDALATPLGSHPIVASPEYGCFLYYFWCYTGNALEKEYNKYATDVGIYRK